MTLYAGSFGTEANRKKFPTGFTWEYGHTIQMLCLIITHKAQIKELISTLKFNEVMLS